MGQMVVKVAPDEDLYVVWSSIVESPLMWGTGAEVVDFLVERDREKEQHARPRAVQSIQRADEFGSSSMFPGSTCRCWNRSMTDRWGLHRDARRLA